MTPDYAAAAANLAKAIAALGAGPHVRPAAVALSRMRKAHVVALYLAHRAAGRPFGSIGPGWVKLWAKAHRNPWPRKSKAR